MRQRSSSPAMVGRSLGRTRDRLLLVTLHDLRRPRARRRNVLVELPACPPLSQQVPRLVESGPDLPQALFLFGGDARANVAFLELSFFGDELRDALVQLSVFHRVSPLSVTGHDAEGSTGEAAIYAGSPDSSRSGATSSAMNRRWSRSPISRI